MRHVVLRRALVAASAIATIAWTAGMAAALNHTDPQRVTTAAAPALVEEPSCWAPTEATELPSGDGAMVQTIAVTILPTAILRVDAAGRVVAAETNTGCAPRPTDQLFVEQADGTLAPAHGIDVAAVDWTGDFTVFGFVAQQG